MREQVLGQFFDDPTDSSNEQIMMDLMRDQRRMGLLGPNGFEIAAQWVSDLEIISLPQGAMAAGLAVISGDRRYVRITPLPFFSQIGDVTTFNFVTGDQSTQLAPAEAAVASEAEAEAASAAAAVAASVTRPPFIGKIACRSNSQHCLRSFASNNFQRQDLLKVDPAFFRFVR